MSTRTLDNLADPAYWARLCPELTVSGKLGSKAAKNKKPASELVKDAKEQVLSEGVVQLHPSDLQWGVDVHVLARSMVALMQAGWPASFLIMYDEVWALVQQASSLMAGATGGNACNMDVLCWYVDPNAGAAGFSPHRDRQPNNSPATFRPDGTAMYSTCWVPLTDARPRKLLPVRAAALGGPRLLWTDWTAPVSIQHCFWARSTWPAELASSFS
ncbi:hypothetical protein HYH02_010412 [Chlamydomonas schloesseri]|uniref:Uncharacterized protein n=1 Tax=Chlamydomonas schloesseri TaxID=2026947 RepID=A0A835W7W5_9CHLO|nr:hypothetical protein HYH02_010412 [Chlamydomonas schloesseri]|eukprot:KAG2440534.1 hypothetical protein HYH02_010412 [Chlamydomonas schloesseri]